MNAWIANDQALRIQLKTGKETEQHTKIREGVKRNPIFLGLSSKIPKIVSKSLFFGPKKTTFFWQKVTFNVLSVLS